ncbi:hypothetical protein [Pedobacter frigidisoli]|uniref:hypothetical protein n=1 Tax=Pedobacter frigidisoli TaxID=2530455 RepID=UPI00292CDDCF|nr:hypothetical protein [Pedobacter frigidisoli]
MLEKLTKLPKYFQFFTRDNISNHKECYLLGEDDEKIIMQQWLDYSLPETDIRYWEHPNSLMEYIPCHITETSTTHFNITLLLDRSRRFHTVTRTLPKEFFRIAFLPFTSESRPYIIVDQEWFDQLHRNLYSSYVMIDFIGIGSVLNHYGEFPVAKLSQIKTIIDVHSRANPDIQFLSCADNIIIKTGWRFRSEDQDYQPEKLISMVNQIMTEISIQTSLSSYAIFTQGANYVNELEMPPSDTPNNHLFISSISAPFMESFAIDEHIRSLIRAKKIEARPFYLEKSFYLSTRRKYTVQNEPHDFKSQNFEHQKTGKIITYTPLAYSQICDLIDI